MFLIIGGKYETPKISLHCDHQYSNYADVCRDCD